MREVTVERFVGATPAEVRRALEPSVVVEYEGSFEVLDIEERDEATFVTAGARGVGVALRFEPREAGLRYEQVGDAGPFDEMWTDLTWAADDEGTRVTATSGVGLGLPLAAVTDRVAAWKRRGELDRALARLADDLG
ncbi:SRPBCC family protein [Halosimplex rubrum]|uniref:SRPBCC family protein n=1 Tax=Halosimplex rubrum TaxID=869889 RepID=A0A7D5NZH7_9EURY|nr:SRPBCC family protein [Halosimplex rubrum]QLH77126.1 SRPBCC family protein [Halosimplex rubrum]